MYASLIQKLLGHKRVAIFSHLRPDGDCLGAQTGLALWFKKNGLDVTALNEDTIPDNLSWLMDFNEVVKPDSVDLESFDAFVFVDGNALHRFGPNAKAAGELGKPLYMIDHHPQPDDIFDEAISVTTASSTCELIYNLFVEHDADQIDTQVAKSLYTGILTDTGSFQFDSVTPQTMRAGADLLERGKFSPDAVISNVYSSRKFNQLSLLGKALDSISVMDNGLIASMIVTKKMLDDTNSTAEDTEGFVQYPLSLDGVISCAFFREDDDRIKISLRSRSDIIDVNDWARKFNGGGHKRASGAFYLGSMDEAVSIVLAEGLNQIKE